MGYTDFLQMYAEDVKRAPKDLLQQKPLGFAVSTNIRGEKLVSFFKKTIDFDFKGCRVLDIGCAYGGLSIALNKAGAKVSGVDVSPKFIEYATANAKGVADIEFCVADASSVVLRRLFDRGSFDFVIINDVLEHIYDTSGLAANLNWLLSDRGIVYFKVPNGYSPRFIISEGHRKIFALTLLDPDCWFHLYPKRASIFYRPLSYFRAIFEHHQMPDFLLVDEEQVLKRFGPRKLKTQIKDVFNKARDFSYPNADIRNYVRQGILKFREEFFYDLENSDLDIVRFKYGSYFFHGFFARSKAMPAVRTPVRELAGIGPLAEVAVDLPSVD